MKTLRTLLIAVCISSSLIACTKQTLSVPQNSSIVPPASTDTVVTIKDTVAKVDSVPSVPTDTVPVVAKVDSIPVTLYLSTLYTADQYLKIYVNDSVVHEVHYEGTEILEDGIFLLNVAPGARIRVVLNSGDAYMQIQVRKDQCVEANDELYNDYVDPGWEFTRAFKIDGSYKNYSIYASIQV